ncbi:hypothetical protein PIB30_030918 [Stylosanthes scabra]|uniref:TF-B3 domain-containing protein n=1 Tax=Stylosanthes scabra TaxID=79078 RepID=A0ABU6Z8J1_9FABA|nr:hypothetical protein [Stylosanthes scabra]
MAKSYLKNNRLYVPIGFAQELRLFGTRSIWNVIGPSTIDNRIFTFVATNNEERNPLEFYIGKDWQRFRTAYHLTTRDSVVFHIVNPVRRIMRIRIIRNV